jgi:hypothetical protein
MIKNFIYFNILFIFGFLFYLFSIYLNLDLSNTFYLFFSIFATVIPILFLSSGYEYQNEDERKGYILLFIGFCIYGVANLLWFFSDFGIFETPIEYLNFLFLTQVLCKHYFLRYLASLNKDSRHLKFFQNIFSLNIGLILLALFLGNSFNLYEYYYDFYFILESIFSITCLLVFLRGEIFTHIDLRYFVLGHLIWLTADSLFLIENLRQVYFMGTISDFIYYIGFYIMLYSIIFKNFQFTSKINFYLEKNLSLS